MRILWKALLLIAATLRGALAQAPQQQLLVVPSRLILAGDDRSAEVILSNQGAAPATFDATFRRFEMDAEGRLTERQLGTDSAARMLVVAPSSTRLAPGESQVFRLALRLPETLPSGEYLIHLACQARPETPPGGGQGEALLPGLSLPVIIRNGTSPARVSIRDFVLQGGANAEASLRLCREGDQSVFGDLLLEAEDASGALRPVGSRQGIAVYANLPGRFLNIPLETGSLRAGERLRALFVARDQEARAEAVAR